MPLIVVEGIDGSGKTTLVAAIKERLEKVGKDVIVFREPGGTPDGEVIRKMIEDSTNKAERCLLFLAARATLVSYVKKHLEIKGRIVILDRWSPSTLAYQTADFPEEWIIGADRIAKQGLRADLVLWLDIPVDEALQRLKHLNNDLTDYETPAFLRHAEGQYARQYLKDQQDLKVWRKIDATLPPGEILEEAINCMAVLIATGSLTFKRE